MGLRRSNIPWLVNGLLYYVIICSCQQSLARDTIEHGVPLMDNGKDKLVSDGVFELGFFTPEGNLSVRRYVGIWNKFSPQTVVWVADRDKPISIRDDGVFGIKDDGTLQVWSKSTNVSHWSAKTEPSDQVSNLTAKLTVSGNLVFGKSTSSFWESFRHPTDTFLPGMEMGSEVELISWREKDDPIPGEFTFKRDGQQSNPPQYMVMKGLVPYWKSEAKFATQDKSK